MAFRIYYGDGTTHDGATDEDAFIAPAVNVQAVNVSTPYPATLTSAPVYIWTGETWRQCDEMGFWDYMMLHEGPLKALFGRTIRDISFEEIKRRAQNEGLG